MGKVLYSDLLPFLEKRFKWTPYGTKTDYIAQVLDVKQRDNDLSVLLGVKELGNVWVSVNEDLYNQMKRKQI
jgi:hypothetical protein